MPRSDTHIGSDINAQGPTFLICRFFQFFLLYPKNIPFISINMGYTARRLEAKTLHI